ncbi:hypothetical protein [Parahaliea aestuarii]|uniref:Uncharacterized protein n=1 Tax=Parahaliea aestuarii TaxID=1852021 RepID=A0A5C8ZKS9_9GAMM|nr:hypothetical protein [Parahaliea aestuarii]TXS89186.1 hypothetical protein FVW59_18865 [Parahaliea aestuarii]
MTIRTLARRAGSARLTLTSLALIPALTLAGESLNKREQQAVAPFLGFYQGAFDTALSASPLDDLNINPCRDCDTHGDPLKDIYLQVATVDHSLHISFHRSPDSPAFDLLGKYCRSGVGKLKQLESRDGKGKDSGEDYRVTTATFAFDPGRCPRNIAENKAPELTLSLLENRSRGMHFAKVEIDKDLRRVTTLTAENREGERVAVKSNPADYGKDRRETRSYVYEDEMAESSYLRSDTTETRYFAIPVALNGYVGANLTWWPHKILDVEANTEEVLTRHTGVFMPVEQ